MNSTSQHAAAFDTFADEYDRWFDSHPFTFQSEVEAIRRFLPKDGVGVEIGIGTGRFAAALGITLGVEPSKAMAARHRRARARGLQVYQAEAEILPFADETFDFVLMVDVLCFVRDPVKSTEEAHRVLKPSGRIVLALIDRATQLGKTSLLSKIS
jgi:SAM-dependent methyltransferase